jgi:hypothetical protein
MTDSPNKVLMKAVKDAVKEWRHAVRNLRRGRRPVRRGAAAAAAVTLAAGMVAAPATAAIPDPSTDDHPQASTAPKGVQLAQGGVPVRGPVSIPRVNQVPPRGIAVPPGNQSGYPPQRLPRGQRDPSVPETEGLIEFNDEAREFLRTLAEGLHAKELYEEHKREEQERAKELGLPDPYEYIGPNPYPEHFFEADPPGPRNEGPSALDQDQRLAANRDLADRGVLEPRGYLNEYPAWRAIGPTDVRQVDDRFLGDLQWLHDQLQDSHLPEQPRKDYETRLAELLYQIQHVPDRTRLNDLVDAYNTLKDQFNRDELAHRDANNDYGPQGRQVPRALDPGMPEPAPESLRQSKAELGAQQEQAALEAARQRALEPGVFTGGGVNVGTRDTNPGPVGGDPAAVLAAAQQAALEPGVMTGGGVNVGTPDTDPGPVGGDPAAAARAQALAPGVMTGGGVNVGTPETNPGPVGGNGQDDPSESTNGIIDQGRPTETEPSETEDTPGDVDGDPSTDNGRTSPDSPGENSTETEPSVDTDTMPGTPSESETSPGDSSFDSQGSTDTSTDTDAGDSDAGGTEGASESTGFGGDDSAGGYGGGDSADSGFGGGDSSDSSSYGGGDSSDSSSFGGGGGDSSDSSSYGGGDSSDSSSFGGGGDSSDSSSYGGGDSSSYGGGDSSSYGGGSSSYGGGDSSGGDGGSSGGDGGSSGGGDGGE